MSKKIIITSIATLTIILVVLVGYYLSTQRSDGGTSGGEEGGFMSFFPFGGSGDETVPVIENNQSSTTNDTLQKNFTQKLRKISLEPVSGAGTLDIKAGTVVRHIEKATGHIYETELFSPNQSRISNTTIPVVYDAVWLNKNTSLIARYLKEDNQTVDTYSLTVKNISTTTENTISGIALPVNISDVSVFGSSVFYLEKNNTSSLGFVANFDGTKKKQIWISPIKELLSQYVNARTVTLTTKPASNVPGFLYSVDTTNGQVKKLLGDIMGLSTLSNEDLSKILYLQQESTASLFIFDTKTKSTTKISPTTFPEKCVWSKLDKTIVYCAVPKVFIDGGSQTSWYKGLVSFSDDIWKYDTKNNTSEILVNLTEESNENIDVIKPVLSENERYLVFMNKTDNFLWSLDLNN